MSMNAKITKISGTIEDDNGEIISLVSSNIIAHCTQRACTKLKEDVHLGCLNKSLGIEHSGVHSVTETLESNQINSTRPSHNILVSEKEKPNLSIESILEHIKEQFPESVTHRTIPIMSITIKTQTFPKL